MSRTFFVRFGLVMVCLLATAIGWRSLRSAVQATESANSQPYHEPSEVGAPRIAKGLNAAVLPSASGSLHGEPGASETVRAGRVVEPAKLAQRQGAAMR